MDDCFSSPQLFFRSIQPKNKQLWYRSTQQKEHAGKLLAKEVEVGTSAICWKDKQEVYLSLLCTSLPPTKHHVIMWTKPLCIERDNSNNGFVDMSDMTANNYSVSRNTWKWAKKKKLFLHLVDLTALNSFMIHCLRGGTLNYDCFVIDL